VLSKGLVLLTSVGAETIAGAKENPLSHIFILLCSYQLYKIYTNIWCLCVHCDYDLIVINLFKYVLTGNLKEEKVRIVQTLIHTPPLLVWAMCSSIGIRVRFLQTQFKHRKVDPEEMGGHMALSAIEAPLFDGTDYSKWRENMKQFLKSKVSEVWNSVVRNPWDLTTSNNLSKITVQRR
jgi:hypothetical protein